MSLLVIFDVPLRVPVVSGGKLCIDLGFILNISDLFRVEKTLSLSSLSLLGVGESTPMKLLNLRPKGNRC